MIYPELSYILMGILFEIQNKLGTKYQEKHYQKAFESLLIQNSISYKKEVPISVEYGQKIIGNFAADFVVKDKILLEFKCAPRVTDDHIKQVLRYIQALNLKLGLIVNFRVRPLKPLRVLNSKINYS